MSTRVDHYWPPLGTERARHICNKGPSLCGECLIEESIQKKAAQELREGELELLARQLHNVLSEHPPIRCPGCHGTFLNTARRLKELGVVPT